MASSSSALAKKLSMYTDGSGVNLDNKLSKEYGQGTPPGNILYQAASSKVKHMKHGSSATDENTRRTNQINKINGLANKRQSEHTPSSSSRNEVNTMLEQPASSM